MTFISDSSGVPQPPPGVPLRSAGSTPSAGAPRPGETLVLGAEATRYEIVRSLGTGGTAEVFLARRLGPAGFARPVALKSILAGLDVNEAARRAFVYEARLASRLRHPNIAEAHDLAVVGDRYYLVLEYVDGVTVRRAMRAAREAGRPLDEAFSCHVAASVADALHHAHTLVDEDGSPLGIVHRDVTAVNVMVARSGAVKLLDFGVALARLEGRERTRTGQFRGTFVYASPEQASGEELDGRSDLFSLGVVLVEMLTGIRVFDAETDMSTMRKIAECSPTEVRAAIAHVPRELAAICARALARRPQDRFQDGAALSRALREYLTGKGVTYSPSDCATELTALGAFARAPASNGDDASEVEFPSTAAVNGHATITAVAPSPPERSTRRLRAVLAAAVLGIVIAAAGALKVIPQFGRRATSLPTAELTATVAQAKGTAPAPVPAIPTPPPERAGADPAPTTESDPIVRPKRPAGIARVAPGDAGTAAPALVRREHATARTTSAEFADRETVGSPRATLPRGTLVPVKLLRALAGPNPGRAEAVVTEEVAGNGILLVPKGSTVSCSARPPSDGRVRLLCDRISTSDGVLTFSGVAVGEGQHLGLRLLDDEIAAGTPFVVYVSAPAALR